MSETREYSRRKGVANDHGIKFEWHTTSLAYLRCEDLHQNFVKKQIKNVKSFLVANNVNDIGAFDDVVVRVEYTEDGVNMKKKVIFVQCKHKEDPNANVRELLSKSDVNKFFDSFASVLQILKNDDEGICCEKLTNITRKKIKNEFNRENEFSDCMARREELKTLLDCNISDCEFMLFTNASTPKSANNMVREGSNEEDDEEYDITSEIFKSVVQGNSFYFRPETLETLGLSDNISNWDNFNEDEFEYLKKTFIEKFKIYCRQEIDIEIDIGNLIKRKYLSQNISHENLITEIEHNFSGEQCTVLSEKSNLLPLVESYSKLNAQLSNAKVDFHSHLTSDSIFSDAVTALNREIKHARENIYRNEKLRKHEMIQLSVYLNMMQREKNLLVFIDNDSDEDAWRNARETKIYKKFKEVFVVCSDSLNVFERRENEFLIEIVPVVVRDDEEMILQ